MLLLDLEKVNATVGPGEAVMNTLIGMGTVFVVLILISIIIFLLKYVPKMFEKKKAEPEAAKQEKPAAKAVDGRAMQANEFVQFLYIQCCFILCSNERIFRGESLHSLYGRGEGDGSNFAKILRIPQRAWRL